MCNRCFAHEESLKRHMRLDHTAADKAACGALIEHQEEKQLMAEVGAGAFNYNSPDYSFCLKNELDK